MNKIKNFSAFLLGALILSACTLWPAWMSDIKRGNSSAFTFNPSGYTNSQLISIDNTTDGGYVACGSALEYIGQDSYTNDGFWVIKVSSEMEKLWEYLYPEGEAYRVIGTSDGGAIACGVNNAGNYIIKLGSDGSSNWVYTNGTGSSGSVTELPGNIYVVAQGTNLMKFDQNGTLLLLTNYSDNLNYLDIDIANDNTLIALTLVVGGVNDDFYPEIYDTNGNVLNYGDKIDETYGDETWLSIAAKSDGEFAVCGENLYGSLMAFNADGTEKWSIFNELDNGICYDVIVNSDGNYITVGKEKYEDALTLDELDTLGDIVNDYSRSISAINITAIQSSVCQNTNDDYVIASTSGNYEGIIVEVGK